MEYREPRLLKESYRYPLRKYLTISKEGTVENLHREPNTLSGLLKDATSFGLKLFKVERIAIQADNHNNGQCENNLP